MRDFDWKWTVAGWAGFIAVLLIYGFGMRSARFAYDDLLDTYRATAAQADRSQAMLEESRAQHAELVNLVKFCLEGER